MLADDRDAHELRGDDVRRSIAWCGAWTHLFDSILRANLALAAPHVTDAKLIEGLRHAQLGGWFSRLADGLDTPSARTAAPCRAGNGSGSE